MLSSLCFGGSDACVQCADVLLQASSRLLFDLHSGHARSRRHQKNNLCKALCGFSEADFERCGASMLSIGASLDK